MDMIWESSRKRAELRSQYFINKTILYLGGTLLAYSLLGLFLNGWIAFALVLACIVFVDRKVLPKYRKNNFESINKKYPLSFELVSLSDASSVVPEETTKDVDNSPDMR